jgi:signal transduction histidine kinase/DNA-binding response OmpR family regulator
MTGAATFEEVRRQTNLQGLKAAALVAFVVVSSFALVEYYVVPQHFYLLQVLRVPCLLVLAVIVLLAFRYEDWTRRHVDPLTIGAFLVCGWYSIALMTLHDGYQSAFFLTLVFIIVGVGAVTLWPLGTAFFYMALIIASYFGPLVLGLVDLESPDTFVIQLSFLFGMAIISVVAQQLRYQIQKREFETNQRLQQTKASLEQAYDQLQELDQLKTEFFANVSHELRTPLTLSLGPLESLLKAERTPDEEQHLKALHRNQLRLLRLINQLLDVAKVESGRNRAEYSRQDLVGLVRSVVTEVKNAARAKGLEIELIAPLQPVWLYLDREKLEQAMLNLLSNAFKFTEEGGRIQVSVREEDDSARISVSDTGVGIARDKLHTIFDRFAQVDGSETRRYSGTGIGLALVKSHVELHGGTIDVESEQGKGTIFTISLPRGKAHLAPDQVREASGTEPTTRLREHQLVDFRVEPDEEGEPERTAHEAQRANVDDRSATDNGDWLPSLTELSGTKPRVLVVDDTPDMRRYLASILSADYEVRTAKDGAEGLRETKAWDPDLVVSDVMMPNLSGPELCKAIKRGGGRLSRTPVVLVTARAEEQTKLRGLDFGADDYLLKPFLQDELLLRVRNLATKRRQERALFDAHLTLRAQHKYILSDLELARDFQNDLLSELDMPAPLAAHVEFRPADIVGGDFYHLTSLGSKRVRLFVADMVDHGVKAAVRAAAAWPEYTSLDHQNLGPANVLERLNDLATSKYGDLSGSFLCMDFDVTADDHVSIQYAQAGEMPFTLVSEAGSISPRAAPGFMIGLFPNMSYESRELTGRPGTRLFLYTDGLYTQSNESGRTFRDVGLKEAWEMAMECAHIRAATEAVINELDRFRGATAQLDDVTLIGIEVES